MKILLTGNLGFIGWNLSQSMKVVGVDKAVNEINLERYTLNPTDCYLADITNAQIMDTIVEAEKPDIVIGMAAETFVDSSIKDPMPFINTNIIGTQVLTNMCLKHNVGRYIHMSTDEVYGQYLDIRDAMGNGWKEKHRINPRNPYAASKAASEHIVQAAHHTHGLQFNIIRSCNVFGPGQKAENFIPSIIRSINERRPTVVFGEGKQFRQYLFVGDLIKAIDTIITNGAPNEVYNVGDRNYFTSCEMVDFISMLMDKPTIKKFVADRKGHDFGYSVCSDKLRNIGWSPDSRMGTNMMNTIKSFAQHRNAP